MIIHLGLAGAINEIQGSEILRSPLLDLFRSSGSCCQGAELACLRFLNKRSV
ncbi:hypothetical protein SynBIOSU31_02724 [Synechococcus sp. BIOS-U3-1]|nr:hypothetical protein SynBIOSU31_02724 [Synechococcus sp. BIOS-U3-1]